MGAKQESGGKHIGKIPGGIRRVMQNYLGTTTPESAIGESTPGKVQFEQFNPQEAREVLSSWSYRRTDNSRSLRDRPYILRHVFESVNDDGKKWSMTVCPDKRKVEISQGRFHDQTVKLSGINEVSSERGEHMIFYSPNGHLKITPVGWESTVAELKSTGSFFR